MKDLTIEICNEYSLKGKSLGNGAAVVGERKKLVNELQQRYGISELWAINVVNGHGIKDYIAVQLPRLKKQWMYKGEKR